METNFDEGISDDVLRGSFLALKQLQTKGKKAIGKLEKKSSTAAIDEEKGRRSQLFEKFKELNKFDDNENIRLDTRIPISRLMYATYDKIFTEKRKKKRFLPNEKPDHPFFGQNACLAEDFTFLATEGPSAHHQEIIEGLEIEGLIRKYNYNMNSPIDVRSKTGFDIAIPSKPNGSSEVRKSSKAESTLTPELLESVQKVLVSEDEESCQ